MNSIIDPKAKVGKNVRIGDYTKVSGNAVLEDGVVIGDWCKIGFDEPINEKAIVSKNRAYGKFLLPAKCVIKKKTIVCDRATICNKVIIGQNCRIGIDAYIRSNCRLGENIIIGAWCGIGNFVKVEDDSVVLNYCSIGSTSRIGRNVFIGPGVVVAENKHMLNTYGARKGCIISNSAKIGSNSVIISCNIGKNAVVGALSTVRKDIPAGALYLNKSCGIIKR